MTDQKNSLATLSPSQSDTFLCDPNSWEITRDDDETFHGQSSDKLLKEAEAECERRPSKRSVTTDASAAKAPHTK
jgi:hypothetical protein